MTKILNKTKQIKTRVYIDGANVFYTQKHLGWNLDWRKTVRMLKKLYGASQINYYTGIKNHDLKMKKYLNYLQKIGIRTITKPLKIIHGKGGQVIYKSNCDIEMAVDILLAVNNFGILVIFSGDSDFVYLIKVLQQKFRKKVIIYSSRKTISWEIRLVSNKHFFLEDLKNQLKKTVPQSGTVL